MFYKKGVLGNFAKYTRKHLCQSLFLNKVAGLQLWWLFLYLVHVHKTFRGPPESYLNNLGRIFGSSLENGSPTHCSTHFYESTNFLFLNLVPEAFSSWCYQACYLVFKFLKSRKQIWKCFEGTLIGLLKSVYHEQSPTEKILDIGSFGAHFG